MKNVARVPLVGLILAASEARAQAPAPSPSPTPPAYTETIQVTATRVPEDVDAVPTSIQAVGAQELQDRGARDLKSALALLAGVDIAPGGDAGPAASVPEFWGLKEFDAFLLVVDGVPWGGAFNPALTTLDLSDVERIEVQRGPAPVMYGATSFVGVVQVVRRAPGEPGTRLALSGGSYSSGAGSLSSRVPRWLGFDSSFSADFEHQGFKDDRTSFDRGHVLWRNRHTTSSSAFSFDLDATFLRQEPASPAPRQGTTLSPLVPIDSNHNPAGAKLDENRFFANLGFDKSLGLGSWNTRLAFTHSSQEQFRGFLTAVTSTAPNAAGFRADIQQNDLYFDSHLAFTRSRSWKLVLGADYLFGKAEADGETFPYTVRLDGSGAPQSIPTGAERGFGDTRNFGGVYANLEWTPGPAWRLEGGARLNHTQEERGEDQAEEGGGGPEPRREVTRVSGGGGVTFTPWRRGGDRLSLFANAKSSFKPAAIDFNLAEEEAGEEAILKPETATSVEGGVKTELLGRRLRIELAAFWMDFQNLVIPQAVGGLPALTNAGNTRLKGLEASAVWSPRKALYVRGSYAHHDARFRDYLTEFDGVPTQLSGKRLEMSPHSLASFGLSWAPERGLIATAEASYVGDRYLNKRNTALAESYATLAGSLGYRWGKWEARFVGRNLTDRRDPVSESELGDSQYYRLFPRRFDLQASVRF